MRREEANASLHYKLYHSATLTACMALIAIGVSR